MIAILLSPLEVAQHMAEAVREKRLALNLSQKSLAVKSGVSYAVLKKFEATGEISLRSLLKIALVLDCLHEFMELFKPKETYVTLDEVLNQKTRKRGRK